MPLLIIPIQAISSWLSEIFDGFDSRFIPLKTFDIKTSDDSQGEIVEKYAGQVAVTWSEFHLIG